MQFGPGEYETQGSGWQMALVDTDWVDGDQSLVIAVFGVKVWRQVIVVVHANGDAEKLVLNCIALTIDWQFRSVDAQIRLKRLYPVFTV
jgi:hypothetical protein